MTQVQAEAAGLVKIGAIAAMNIARALSLPDTSIKLIEESISDEINAMSAHFTLAIADLQTQMEVEVNRVKATFSFIEENALAVGIASATVFMLGAAVGHFV